MRTLKKLKRDEAITAVRLGTNDTFKGVLDSLKMRPELYKSQLDEVENLENSHLESILFDLYGGDLEDGFTYKVI